MRKFNVAVVGATGAVGEELFRVLEEYDFPINKLIPLASSRSAGSKVEYKNPGKTDLSIAAACSAFAKIIPPRGPRKTLCVVKETTSAYGTGEGIALPATRPMK